MSDQEVTYSTLRFLQSPSESQNRLRCDVTRSPRKAADKVFQNIQEKHHQQEILGNFSKNYHIMQKDNYLKEQLLTNTSLKCESLKNKILQLESNHENKCHKKIEIFSKLWQSEGMLCEGHWSCCGVKCYHFTKSKKNWEECKKTCQDNGLSLLKINDEDERVPWAQIHVYSLGLCHSPLGLRY
uniref:Ly49-like N-terminal domain-containing protein n=1 Tax=Sciurus vulgaris TaxID=55149 RepID=A0A8D2AP16_SCIVU